VSSALSILISLDRPAVAGTRLKQMSIIVGRIGPALQLYDQRIAIWSQCRVGCKHVLTLATVTVGRRTRFHL
jgi:hypothetical protein